MAFSSNPGAAVSSKAKAVIVGVLEAMSPAARQTLKEKLEQLSTSEAKAVTDDQARVKAVALRARLDADREMSAAILKLNEHQRGELLGGDAFESKARFEYISTLAKWFTKMNGAIMPAAAMDQASPDEIRKALVQLATSYEKMTAQAEWEAFSAATAKMRDTAVEKAKEERDRAAEAERKESKREADRAQSRIDNALREARRSGPGENPNVKCTMVLGTKQATGRSGWEGKAHAAVEDLLSHVRSTGEWDKYNCAEVDALNNFITTHHSNIKSWKEIPAGITSRALEWRSVKGALGWQDRIACTNCKQWLAMIGADYK